MTLTPYIPDERLDPTQPDERTELRLRLAVLEASLREMRRELDALRSEMGGGLWS